MIGLLHTHTENSIKDCAVRVADLVKTAKSCGYEAVALTDTDTMTGIAEFVNSAKACGIKPVPGVELAIQHDDTIAHINLMAKDYMGYVGLCKAVSDANRKLVNDIPVLSFFALSDYFGMNSIYHEHVYATSGCEGGILWDLSCSRMITEKKIRSAQSELQNIENQTADLCALKDEAISVADELDNLQDEKKDLEAKAGKNFSYKEEKLEALKGSGLYHEALIGLESEKAESRLAESKVKSVSQKISRRKKRLADIQNSINESEYLLEKASKLKKEIEDEQEYAALKQDAFADVMNEALCYRQIFGSDYFYIELFYHGTEEEMEALSILSLVAKEANIPTVISNDVHLLTNSSENVLQRRLIQSLKDNKWQDGTKYDPEYCIKTEEELADVFAGLISEHMIAQSFENMHAVFDACSFDLPSDKHYPHYEDDKGRSAKCALEEEVRNNIPVKFKGHAWTKEYEDRLQYELTVIENAGYADYTMIISEILKQGRKGPGDGLPGDYIGPGRGSGVGSLVNYLLDITCLDPLKYGLIFERYLNSERVSPPDIDSDIATSTRPMLVKYITEKYSKKGSDAIGVCSIVTKSRLTARDAIRAAGRIVSSRLYDNAAKLYFTADKIAKTIPMQPKVTLASCKEELDEFTDDVEQEIIYDAKLIENVLSKYGTHAAGIIISDSGDVTDYAPVMNAGTNEEPEWTIQFDKDQSEQIGLLKLDALGLSTLDIITLTLQRIYKETGDVIDINNIPFEKNVFLEIYAKGNTVGVFQCKSYGMQKLWKDMQPDCIDDIIAGIALYRPGPMDYIPQYIEGKKHPHSIQYITPELEPILKDTYGTIVYQEQVMRIVRDLAGYSMGRSDLVRRAMSKKKQDIMDEERQNFIYGNEHDGIPGCINNGISEDKAAKVYDLMVDFAKYAFNKSHAAAYAMLSYQTAWLKYHYPLEFLVESMNVEKTDNIPLFVEECKKNGFEVLPPDVNRSEMGFSIYNGKVLYGLGNVKGVRNGAVPIIRNRKTSHYTSFQDYLIRSEADSGATKALISGGAFDAFCHSRRTLRILFDQLSKPLARYKTVKKRIQAKEEKLSDCTTKKDSDRIQKSLKNDQDKLAKIRNQILSVPIRKYMHDSKAELLNNEKSVLFAYISEHPIDRYADALHDTEPICELKASEHVKIAGLVKNINRFKKDNAEMAFFSLEDKTGTVKVFCGAKQMKAYAHLIQDDSVIRVYGDCRTDKKDSDSLVVYLSYADRPNTREPEIIFEADDLEQFKEKILPEINRYKSEVGHMAYVFEYKTGKIIPLNFYVSHEIEESQIIYSMPDKYIEGGAVIEPSQEQDVGI